MARGIGIHDYQEFDPVTEWVHEEDCDTLLLHLPDFRKEQLKVQASTARTLRISGERPLGGNKWSRFSKEFSMPPNCDPNKISAKFVGGMLYIRQPKMIIPAGKKEKEEEDRPASAEQAKPAKPKDDPPQPQKLGQETAKTAINLDEKTDTLPGTGNAARDAPKREKAERDDADNVPGKSGSEEGMRKEDKEEGKAASDEKKESRYEDAKSEPEAENHGEVAGSHRMELGKPRTWMSLVVLVLFAVMVGLHLIYGKF